MALPLIAGGIFSGVVAGLTQFFASRAATILGGLGVALVITTGLDALAGTLIGSMTSLAGQIGGVGGNMGGTSLGAYVFQMMAFGGVFDALNIVISGYLTMWALVATKVWLTRVSS